MNKKERQKEAIKLINYWSFSNKRKTPKAWNTFAKAISMNVLQLEELAIELDYGYAGNFPSNISPHDKWLAKEHKESDKFIAAIESCVPAIKIAYVIDVLSKGK